ncbi:MAG: PKD domain-containing protein, partial [Solirubrobacteraceae bacterium]
NNTVSVIDTATNSVVGAPIPVGSTPHGVAITPDGRFAYVANFGSGTVSVIDTGTNSVVGAPITVGAKPDGIAIAPDGGHAFVAQQGNDISIVDTATKAVVGSVPDSLGPSQISIGPRGGRAFVTNSGSSSVSAFSPSTGGLIGSPIPVGPQPSGIAVAPNGVLAYAAGYGDGTLRAIRTSLGAPALAPLSGLNQPEGVAIRPDGARGYVTNRGGASVSIIDPTSNTLVGTIPVGASPAGIAITPDQPPRASFWVSPIQRMVKRKLTFHASASSDPDGLIATYAWDFGDGKHAKGPSALRAHRYKKPGTYVVTLVTTDNEGCSTAPVYTGQTASCNGSAAAATSSAITVVDNVGPVLSLAGGRRQRLRGRLNVFAGCPREPCAIRARGVVVTTRRRRDGLRAVRRKHRIIQASASLAAGSWRNLAPRVPTGARRAVLRALRSGGRAKVRVIVVAWDLTGVSTLRRWTVDLVWPRPGHGRR